EAGVAMPDGFEDLASDDDIVSALVQLKTCDPGLRRAVLKLNEGFSGEGNALFRFDDAPPGEGLGDWVRGRLPELLFQARGMDWNIYRAKMAEMGGVAEAFVDGGDKRSPSAQFRINPAGGVEAISTHDQVLGGKTGQEYLGATFPADEQYRLGVQAEGLKAARKLAEKGVLGRFAIDFISLRDGDGWKHHAIEINLRKGGTTHPFLMLQYLTDGAYDAATGLFCTPGGDPRFYYATDNLESECYKGLLPEDLIDIAVRNGIHFHGATQTGVVFHLIGALSEFGKLGCVCVGRNPQDAEQLFRATVAILDRECGGKD
ncbi:MAG: peptide ligase PGM1-related protein, partial [Oricola sp.]